MRSIIPTGLAALLAPIILNVPQPVRAAAPIAVEQVAETRVFQRSTMEGGPFGKGVGTIALGVTLPAAGPVYARMRALDGATILQPVWLAAAQAPAGASKVGIAGIGARLGGFFLDLAPSPEGPWTPGTTELHMGALFVQAPSQSLGVLMTRRAAKDKSLAALGVVPDRNAFVWATSNDSALVAQPGRWAHPSDDGPYGSAFAAQFLNDQIRRLGVSCALVGHATGAMAIGSFLPPAGREYPRWIAALDEAGGFEGAIGMIGHSDASAQTSGSRFNLSVRAARAIMARHNPALGDQFAMALATIPNIASPYWGKPADRDRIRHAGYEAMAASGGHYVQPYDLELVDGVHQTNAGSRTLALHFSRAFAGGDESGNAAALGRRGDSMGDPLQLSPDAAFADVDGARALAGGAAAAPGDVIPGGSEWSWSVRFRLDRGSVRGRAVLVGAGGQGHLHVETDGRLHSGGELPALASRPKVADGRWHVASLVSTGQGVVLSLDGREEARSAAPGPKGYGAVQWVRAYGGPAAFVFPGAIDWVAFGYWGVTTRYELDGDGSAAMSPR